jgi:hypothetical protein
MSLGVLSSGYKFLMAFHLGVLLVSNIIIWIAFYCHWIGWRPKKFHSNMYDISQSPWVAFRQQKSASTNQWYEKLDIFNSARAASLVGSQLLGGADGVKSKLKTAVSVFLVLIAYSGFILVIFDKENFQSFFVVVGQVIFYAMHFFIGKELSMVFFRNISKVWLYFEGERSQFFNCLERAFYGVWLVSAVPILLVHIGVTYFVLDWKLYYESIWITALYSLINILITFYVNLFVYYKTKGSLRWSGLVGILLFIALGIPLVACNLLWVDHKLEIIQSAYFLIICSAIGVLVLRNWVQKKWVSVDFVRVKS